MILLVRRDDEIDRVREGRVRDVVKQTGDLLATVGHPAAEQKKTPGYAR